MQKLFFIIILIAIISCIFNMKYTIQIKDLELEIRDKDLIIQSYDKALTEELNKKESEYFDECFLEE